MVRAPAIAGGSKAASVYMGAVIAGGLLSAGVSLALFHPDATLPVALLVATAGLAQLGSQALFGPTSISLGFPFTFLAILWLGAGAGILTIVPGVLVHAFYPVRRPAHKVAFNFGGLSLSVGVAGALYAAAGGQTPPESFGAALVPALAAAAGYYLVNTFSVSIIVGLTTGQSPLRVWNANRWLSVYYGGLALFALVVATEFHYDQYHGFLFLIPALALPWIVTRLWAARANELEQQKRHVGQLTQLHRVGVAVNNSRSLEQTMALILDGSRELTRCDGLAIFLRDEGEGGMRLGGQMGLGLYLTQAPELGLSRADLEGFTASEVLLTKSCLLESQGQTRVSAVYLPLRAEGQVLGAMGFYFKGVIDLPSGDIQVLSTLGEYAAGAVDRLWKARKIEESSRRLFHVHTRARKEIAASLHGSVQTRLLMLWHRLGAVAGEAGAAEREALVRDLRAEVHELQDSVRSLSSQLYPPLVSAGLLPALRSLGSRFSSVIEVETSVEDGLGSSDAGGRLSEELRLLVYRVAEEALNNVVKHARATRASVKVWTAGDQVQLCVADNGQGFATASGDGSGLGLMQRWAQAGGGTVQVQSALLEGTKVLLKLPIPGGAAVAPGGAGAESGRSAVSTRL